MRAPNRHPQNPGGVSQAGAGPYGMIFRAGDRSISSVTGSSVVLPAMVGAWRIPV
jgi:hypothetical protein